MTLSVIFEKNLRRFAYNQDKKYSLDDSVRYFIPTSIILLYKTPNDEHNFVAKPFLTLDHGEDICSPVWVAVVMSDGVAVKITIIETWYHFLSRLN